MTDSYRNIRFTCSSLARVVDDELADVGALLALRDVQPNVVECLVDGQLEAHGLFNAVAKEVVTAVFQAVERVELVDVVDALLVNVDAQGVTGFVGHTRALAGSGQNAAGRAR